MGLTFYTGYRRQGRAGPDYYLNVLGWKPDGEVNLLKITGPRVDTPTDVRNAQGPESQQGKLWENDLSMISETSKIYVCTKFNSRILTHGPTSVTDFGQDYDTRGNNLGGYFTVASNNDWDEGTTLEFIIINGDAPKGWSPSESPTPTH